MRLVRMREQKLGFIQSSSDHSLFTRSTGSIFVVILVYVDDIILCGNDLLALDKFTTALNHLFKLKDLGDLKYSLGLEVARQSDGIYISQKKYLLKILKDADELVASFSYRRLIGRLLYLITTRPDIYFDVSQLSRFMDKLMDLHMKAAYRVLRYLKGHPGFGLFFLASSNTQLKGFCDSDWAKCYDSRRSITGFGVFLGDSLISWRSKNQDIVSHYSSKIVDIFTKPLLSARHEVLVSKLGMMNIHLPACGSVLSNRSSTIVAPPWVLALKEEGNTSEKRNGIQAHLAQEETQAYTKTKMICWLPPHNILLNKPASEDKRGLANSW